MKRRLPTAFAVINRVGAAARKVGVPVGGLSVDALARAASEQAGLDDFGASDWRDGLGVLVEALEADAELHMIGRIYMRNLLTLALVTRLRLVDARRRDPDLERGPLRPPIIVCGLPRSGTTFLHRMLCERADARLLPLWELMEPIPGPGPDRRLDLARGRIDRLQKLTPVSVDAQHLMRPELPDECGHLFKSSFLSSMYWLAPSYRYLDWYLRQDVLPAYRNYRAHLQLLADPERRLTLKDPFHARHLPALFEVLPDAMVIQTHRDPVEIVPSFHKLIRTMHAVVTDRPDTPRTVASNMRWLRDVADKNLAARAAPDSRIIDVDYRSLVADPIGTVCHVCDHFELEFDDAFESRLEQFVAANQQRKYGLNPYRADEFAQSSDAIAELFADYRARFIGG